MFLLVWQDRVRRAVTPRRVWTAAGVAAAGSTAWIVGLVSLLVSFVPDPAVARAWLTNDVAIPAWNAGTAALQTWTSAAAQQAALMTPMGGTTLTIVVGALLLPAISAAGLYLVMRRTARERARFYAAR